MTALSRRQFLHNTVTVAASSCIAGILSPSLARAMESSTGDSNVHPLTDGWEFLRMPVVGPWEVWINPPLAPWTAVSLPHCFNSYDGCDPDSPAYRGKGWYRRSLKLDNPYFEGRTLLHFEGAGQSTEVYVGEVLVGEHIGGYDEFVLDITEAVNMIAASGVSVTKLSVMCDNSPNLERMPSDLSDFTLYGGLYRRANLVYVPAVSLEMVHVLIDAAEEQPTQVRIEARLYNPLLKEDHAQVTVVVSDPTGKVVYRNANRTAIWDGTVDLTNFTLPQAKLWSPKMPQLYRCTVSIDTAKSKSVQVQRFGVRFYKFEEHGPFVLNGERLRIQGTHRHEDHAEYAAAMPENLIRQEMELIKEMGANFIRLAHYQQQRTVLDLCDELGLLVWEELPWCRAGVGDEAFQAQGREKLTSMIDQHRNHPSIILWGLGNEDDWDAEYPSVDKRAIQAYMEELNALAHRLDSSRQTSYRRADFAREVPDVYAPSIWAGWYGGRFVEYEASLVAQRGQTKRMLHTEWGADAHARRHNEDPYALLSKVKDGDTAERGMAYLLQGGVPRVSSEGDWSESYACDLYDWYLKVQQSLPWLAGAVHWVFKDFTTPLRPDNPVPRINQKGVVERDMTKKEGYFVFQSYWAEKPMAHIYGRTWPVRWGKEGQSRTVKVYSNCPSAELFLNGLSAGKRTRDIQDFPAAGLHWEVPFRGGSNSLRVVATSATGSTVSDEITFDYQTTPWGMPTSLQLRVMERTSNRVTIEANMVDSYGTLCLDARNVVRFSIAGEGRLLDNLGTSTGSRVVQLYNGRACITVLNIGRKSVAAVSSDGIPTMFCLLSPHGDQA